MVNPTYKHLEQRLRVGGLTLGQWAQLAAAALFALGFGIYASPLPAQLTIPISVFVAGLPLAVSYGAMGLEFSVSRFAKAALLWARRPRRYLPGPGPQSLGYRVEARTSEPTAQPARELGHGDLEQLWDS